MQDSSVPPSQHFNFFFFFFVASVSHSEMWSQNTTWKIPEMSGSYIGMWPFRVNRVVRSVAQPTLPSHPSPRASTLRGGECVGGGADTVLPAAGQAWPGGCGPGLCPMAWLAVLSGRTRGALTRSPLLPKLPVLLLSTPHHLHAVTWTAAPVKLPVNTDR